MKVGIFGAGQLAKMLTLAASPLGIKTLCYDPTPNPCAKDITQVTTASFTDVKALEKFAKSVDVITFETENITSEVFSILEQYQDKFYPNQESLLISQDRFLEKQCLNQLNIITAPYALIDSLDELMAAVKKMDMPCILKTTRGGYDGKGQWMIKSEENILKAWEEGGSQGLLLEGFIPFDMEVSMIAVRHQGGAIRTYPLIKNTHQQGILKESFTPFDALDLEHQAKDAIHRLLTHLDYVGVLTIEFFVVKGHLIANEIAPRVHNTGHFSIEGSITSQFENHMRAITGLPLGDTSPRGYSCMLNVIGTPWDEKALLAIDGLHYHTYGKEPRAHRKLGHVTLNHLDKEALLQMQQKVMRMIHQMP